MKIQKLAEMLREADAEGFKRGRESFKSQDLQQEYRKGFRAGNRMGAILATKVVLTYVKQNLSTAVLAPRLEAFLEHCRNHQAPTPSTSILPNAKKEDLN